MPNPFVLGSEPKLYYKVGGQAGAGNWTELTNAREVTQSLTKNEADATTRGNSGYVATVGTLKQVSLEWKMVYDPADASVDAISDAYFDNTVIGLQHFPASSGSEGLQADWMITQLNFEEPIDGIVMLSVTAKITYSATAPSRVTN